MTNKLKKGPIVNLNTHILIEELVGDYNIRSETLVHAIAANQKTLMSGCSTIDEYREKMKSFISENK